MRLLAALAALALAIVPVRAFASPEDILSYGPRSTAMGGTGAAHSDGFEAAYTNPALLSNIRAQKLTLGIEETTFNLHADGAGLPGRISYDSMKSVVIGADIPIPLRGALRDRIGAGIALSTPTQLIVRGVIPYPEQPQFPLLPDRVQSVAVRAGLGVDVGWGIRVGAGFAALAEIDGSAVVATDATGKVGSRVEDELLATYAPTFGATYDLPLHDGATTRIGVTYRGALSARIAVTIDATKLSSLQIPLLNIAGVAQYDPAELAFELARTRGPLTLAVGATWKRWSAYPGLIEPTILCSAAEPDCPALKPPNVAYSNTIVPRVGAEYTIVFDRARRVTADDESPDAPRPLAIHLRAGAFFEPSPLPSTLPSSQAYSATTQGNVDVPTRYFDANRLAFTLGYGLSLGSPLPPIDIDLFAQLHALLPRTIESDAANTATGPVVSRGDVSGTVLAAGLLVGVKF